MKINLDIHYSKITDYDKFCLAAVKDDDIFKDFKQSSIYNKILEHVSEVVGSKYYDIVKHNDNIMENINAIKLNDTIGNPRRYLYGEHLISPTTLRYSKVFMDVSEVAEVEGKTVFEVGGGYGGQSFIFNQLANVEKYIITDLPNVNLLIKKYLNILGCGSNVMCIDANNVFNNTITPDIFLSNYSISELPHNIQERYLNTIIPNSRSGYITYNPFNGYSAYDFYNRIKLHHPSATIKNEHPQTWRYNRVITW